MAKVKGKKKGKSRAQKKEEFVLKIKKTLWLAGHVVTLATSSLVFLLYLCLQGHSAPTNHLYRLTFFAATLTYGLSIDRKLNGQIPSFWALLPIESFQYGCLAFLWLFMRIHVIKLVPYFVYSLLQILNTVHKDNNEHGFITKQAHSLEIATAYCNILLGLRLFLDALLIRPGSVISLIAFGIFYRIRIEYSPVTQETLKSIEAGLDKLIEKPQVPASAKEKWSHLKKSLSNYRENTRVAQEKVKAAAETPKSAKPSAVYNENEFLLDD